MEEVNENSEYVITDRDRKIWSNGDFDLMLAWNAYKYAYLKKKSQEYLEGDKNLSRYEFLKSLVGNDIREEGSFEEISKGLFE